MNKYKNTRGSAADSPKRFSKRPRYGPNNESSVTRYQHQYQYLQNRNNGGDTYQSNQYEKDSRLFYGLPPKGQNHTPNPPSSYTHNSKASLSSTNSLFMPIVQNILNLPTNQKKQNSLPQIKQPPPPNQQQHITSTIMDNSSYYGYNSFYSTNFNADSVRTPAIPSFGVTNGLSPFMWQTIKSTPPPQLLQQQNALLSPQSPPSIQSCLSSTDKLPPQIPPLPPQLTQSAATMMFSACGSRGANAKDTDNHYVFQPAPKTLVKMKQKRKAISDRYKLCRNWSEEDALLAVKTEEENKKKLHKDIILIIRFPDPEISREIVKNYSNDIESVHFQLNYAPRYCLVYLKPNTDIEKTAEKLSKIPFGTGYLSVDIKQISQKSNYSKLSDVDPYTLYVGNLPTTIACKILKDLFPGALRIDIGFASRIKYTRYAFIRYQNVQQAIDAYKRMLDAVIGGRAITLRFRRLTVANDSNREGEVENVNDMADYEIDGSDCLQLSQTCDENTDLNADRLEEPNAIEDNLNESSATRTPDLAANTASETPLDVEKADAIQNSLTPSNFSTDNNSATMSTNSSDDNPTVIANSSQDNENSVLQQSESLLSTDRELDKNCVNGKETVENNISVTSTETECSAEMVNKVQTNFNTTLLNIKHEPDNIDPEDLAIRDKDMSSRFKVPNDNVVKKEERDALYNEFFAAPYDQNEKNRFKKAPKLFRQDLVSLNLNTDETDTTSIVSTNSLGEFLQSCQAVQAQPNNIERVLPIANRNKTLADILYTNTIKREPWENDSNDCQKKLPLFKKKFSLDPVKQDPNLFAENVAQSISSETVSRRRRRSQTNCNVTENISTSSKRNTNSNDDIVPPTAVFFRRNNQNPLSNYNNTDEYNEFYGTSTEVNIKKEHLTIQTNKSANNNTNLIPQVEILTRNNKVNKKLQNSIRCSNNNTLENPTNMSTFLNDDDDFVPGKNLLGSYQPLRSAIKEEKEHDDIFSVPQSKANEVNENRDLVNLYNNHDSNAELHENHKVTEVSESNKSLHVNDDDVLILSDNISQQLKPTNYNNPLFNNFLFTRQTDLVTLKPKCNPYSTLHRKVSTLFYTDNLDKLYDQLDAESDNEL